MITFEQFCKKTRLNESTDHHFVVANFDTSEMPPAAVQYVLDNVSDFDERYRNALDRIGDGYIESLSDADSGLFGDISTAVTEWAKADGIDTEEEDSIPFDWQAVFENPFLLDECNASKKARKGGKGRRAKKVNESIDFKERIMETIADKWKDTDFLQKFAAATKFCLSFGIDLDEIAKDVYWEDPDSIVRAMTSVLSQRAVEDTDYNLAFTEGKFNEDNPNGYSVYCEDNGYNLYDGEDWGDFVESIKDSVAD